MNVLSVNYSLRPKFPLYISLPLNNRLSRWNFLAQNFLFSTSTVPPYHPRSQCSKDDRQSQWGMAKFDPQPTLNPWTDCHQIWNTWLWCGHLPPKNWAQSSQWFCPIYAKYTPKTFKCLLHFFSFLPSAYRWIFTLNTSYRKTVNGKWLPILFTHAGSESINADSQRSNFLQRTSYGEECIILTSTVFDWFTRVTDGWAIAYSVLSIYIHCEAKNAPLFVLQ